MLSVNTKEGNIVWHVDSVFNQHRSGYGILTHRISQRTEIPNSRTRHGSRYLPEVTKKGLRGLMADHDIWHPCRLAAPDAYKTTSDHGKAAKPFACHKIMQKPPDDFEMCSPTETGSRSWVSSWFRKDLLSNAGLYIDIYV